MKQAYRSAICHCLADPGETGDASAMQFIEDGLLIVEDGIVSDIGDAMALLEAHDDIAVDEYPGRIITPGFIDCHVHFPQIDVIASHGEQLLDWLERYAYPGEKRFADSGYAKAAADFFLDELLKNGTTTAAVFATVYPQSADAIFDAAYRRNMRLIAGKVLMDRNSPPDLSDDPQSAYDDSKALIARWHGKGRLGYAITPRFAITSSEEQLEAAGKLADEHPDAWVHTHLAENRDEIDEVARLFSWSNSYLDVYDRYGLLRERSLFAHCLYLEHDDRRKMSDRGAAAIFCPASNLFLGSGLFDLREMNAAGVNVGIATDVGGGTSLSMLRTMAAAYEVLQLRGQNLSASRALYLGTLGAAVALGLDSHIGNLLPGKEADFVVLDPAATPLSERRSAALDSIEEKLFALMILGDDRHIEATYICGERGY
ncbi:MAG: guanine deaminase [Woeseiaceae bacterium]